MITNLDNVINCEAMFAAEEPKPPSESKPGVNNLSIKMLQGRQLTPQHLSTEN